MVAPYYGWYVVTACAIIACFSWGFAFYGLGVYLHVLVPPARLAHGPDLAGRDRLLSRSAPAASWPSVASIDRHGSRGVLAYGVCTMAAALAALGRITALWQLFAVYVLLATAWACLSSTEAQRDAAARGSAAARAAR